MKDLKITPRFGSEADFLLGRAQTLIEDFLTRVDLDASVDVLGADVGPMTVRNQIILVHGAVARLIENEYHRPGLNDYYYRETTIALFDGAVREFLAGFPLLPEADIRSAANFSQALLHRHLPGTYCVDYSQLTGCQWEKTFYLDRLLFQKELPCPPRYGPFIDDCARDTEGALDWLRHEVFRNLYL